MVKEPPKPKGSLVEKGLAWQETFDFGKGGARAFQLPPVGLLQAAPASFCLSCRSKEYFMSSARTRRRIIRG